LEDNIIESPHCGVYTRIYSGNVLNESQKYYKIIIDTILWGDEHNILILLFLFEARYDVNHFYPKNNWPELTIDLLNIFSPRAELASIYFVRRYNNT